MSPRLATAATALAAVLVHAQEPSLVTWKIRDASAISPAGLADVGGGPALFQLGRSDGQSFSTIRLAALGAFRGIDTPGFFEGWEPFVALGWERDSGTDPPKDQRQFVLGLTGQVRDPGIDGTTFLPTLRLGHRQERHTDTRSDFANLHVDVIHLPWVGGDQGEGLNYYALIPFAGVLFGNARSRIPDPALEGGRVGLYAGIRGEAQLYALLPRLTAVASAQWYQDVRAPAASEKRGERFTTVGVRYDLVDPAAKAGWIPSLSLSYQQGTDPVTGEGPARRTVLGLGVKFN